MGDEDHAPRLLIVEDERHIAAGLKLNFELEGYRVHVVGSAREAAARLVEPDGYDAVLLDVMLPDADGFSICRKLRDAGDFTPVLMLTARGTTEDRVKGLEAGADDYLVKPFELSELLARVRSMLRRRVWEREVQLPDTPGSLDLGDVRIDFAAAEAFRGEERISVTQLEIDLLRYFAANPGRVLSRQELQEKVWKLDNYPNSRMVDNFILRLRKHFEPDPAQPRFFVSVRGAGYKFIPSDPSEPASSS